MEKNTNRLLDLTNEMLDFRKTETKRYSLNLEHADVRELVEDACMNFKPVAESKNILFNIELPGIAIPAHIDVEAFNKIISNLIDNALKYAKSKVYVSLLPLHTQDGFLSLLVKNDGYLIPSEMKDKIFEPFFRIRETERQQGSGIGLSIARSLTQLHRGVLELKESEHDLNVFLLKLPVDQHASHSVNNLKSEPALS